MLLKMLRNVQKHAVFIKICPFQQNMQICTKKFLFRLKVKQLSMAHLTKIH